MNVFPLKQFKQLRTAVLAVSAVGALLLGAESAFAAGNCMQDNATAGGGGNLGCTSNDVKIARVTGITPTSGITTNPDGSLSCVGGAPIAFSADFSVVLGATGGARYDVGLYIAQGQTQALTGACNTTIITPTNAPSTFKNLDASPDSCGDITGAVGSAFNPQIVHMAISTTCVGNAQNKLLLPNCTSWRQPGSNGTCTMIQQAFPGSPSKCNCDNGFTIDVTVEHPQLGVDKTVLPTSLDEPGGSATYTVTVTNPATATSVTLNTIVDDPDNDATTNNSVTYQASVICAKTVLAPGGDSTTCTFTRTITGDAGQSFTDKACVNGTDQNNNPVGPTCDTATVSINDVKPTGSVVKTADSVVCADVNYKVKVTNTDKAETLTLSALNDDKFGNVANYTGGVPALGAKVISSQCSVPQTIAINGGTYNCSFVASVCRVDFPHTNTLTGTMSDNEGNSITPTGSATVNNVTLQ
jgi:hypothetical protein